MTVTFPGGPTLYLGMSLPVVSSGYGQWGLSPWGSARWGPDQVFTDLSAYLNGFSTNRSFSETGEWKSGTATLDLDNRDYRFSADYPSSPYTSGGISALLPWKLTQLMATYAGVTYALFTGYTGDWSESLPREAPEVTVPLVDEKSVISGMKAVGIPSAGAGDSYGARLHRVLDAIGNRATRALETGVNTFAASTISGDAVAEMNLATNAEGGRWWVDASGVITARGRYGVITPERSSVSQVTFGTGVGEIHYSTADRATTTNRVINSARYTRTGGTEQILESSDSIARFTRRQEKLTGLPLETDAQALSSASWCVATKSNYQRSLDSITVYPMTAPATMFPAVLGLKEFDLVTVLERRDWGTVTRYCHVRGVAHNARNMTWKSTIYLAPAETLLALSDSRWGIGRWGSARWV